MEPNTNPGLRSQLLGGANFKLLRFFALSSLVIFVLVAILLISIYRRQAVEDLTAIGESKNVALTLAFTNSI